MCKYCKNEKMIFKLRFRPLKEGEPFKYALLHIGEYCAKCGKWQKWIKQDDATIKLIEQMYLNG